MPDGAISFRASARSMIMLRVRPAKQIVQALRTIRSRALPALAMRRNRDAATDPSCAISVVEFALSHVAWWATMETSDRACDATVENQPLPAPPGGSEMPGRLAQRPSPDGVPPGD